MRVPNNTTSAVNLPSEDPKTGTDNTREKLLKTLQDPNTSTREAMTALHGIYSMNGDKKVAGTASEDEVKEWELISSLRSGNISDSDLGALGSRLGMSQESLAGLLKEFQKHDANPESDLTGVEDSI